MNKVSFFVIAIFLSANLFAQKHIERYLADQKLISQEQLEKYYQKRKSNDAYAKMMIKLMKKDKSTRSYVSEMEKEYKAELEKRNHNNDTLAILLNILEPSCEKRPLVEHNNSGQDLSGFVNQLDQKGLITNKDAGEKEYYGKN